MIANLEKIYHAVLAGNRDEAVAATRVALDGKTSAASILNDGLIAAMDEVGRRFEGGEYFVPEMLISARAMQTALEVLRPHLVASDVQPIGKMVVGTVKGDLHDIGKNLVAMMVEGAGFEIIDLGADVAPEKFVSAVRDSGAQLVGLSALLTTTLPMMQTTIAALADAGLRDEVKVIVGGAPVTAGFAEQIGADGFAENASRAATLARSLVT
jgi:5-methyltetrahydrofolate--homocysteine methyltransferase